jgi:hypothetical protein
MIEQSLHEKESDHYFLAFCSMLCIIYGKKLNLPNIVLLLLENQNYRSIFKSMLGVDTDFEIFRMFVNYDSTLSKSKYISKYLNNRKNIKF